MQLVHQLFAFGKGTVGDDKALAFFLGALQRDRTCRATRAQHKHAQIAQIDRKFLSDSAGESFPVSVETAQFSIVDLDRVDRTDALSVFIEIIHQFDRADFVRKGQIHTDKIEFPNEF